MSAHEVTVWSVTPGLLSEGPRWHEERQELLWVDILGRQMHRGTLSPDGTLERVETISVDRHIGAVAPAAGGGYALAAGTGFLFVDDAGSIQELAQPEGDRTDVRMNDGACDPQGRFWAGTMAYDESPGAGTLYRLELDGSCTTVLTGLTISNGIGWSPDASTMYLNDSGTGCVDAFRFDGPSGAISDRRTLVHIDQPGVAPDGLTVDDEGGIWVALWNGTRARCSRSTDSAPAASPACPTAAPRSFEQCPFLITRRDAAMTRPARAGVMTWRGGAGQAGAMRLGGLSGLVGRVVGWADRLQRGHGVLGFPYAVVKKYGDDEGGRQAALITYYGFLSIFPLLLLGVAVLSRVLAGHPELRGRLIAEIVPRALRSSVEHSLATMPASTVPFVAGLAGLLLSGTGVVFSAYQTLNHVAVVRHRFRAGFVARYVRVFAVLAMLMLGALAAGALTVVATALPGQPAVQRAAAVLGSALVVFAVLLVGARLLLVRPAPVRALWPGAVLGAAAVTVVLNAGAPLLARLVARAGPVYGSFATVAGMFALLYLVGQALVYAAEVAAVRYARLWPRALDVNHPTAADARALALRAREEERIPAARIDFHLAAPGSPPAPGGSPPANDDPG